MNTRTLLTMVCLALTTACASSGGRSPGYDRDRISTEELEERSFANMYDVVSSMRPNWLRTAMGPSGSSATSSPLVYVDGRRLGGTDMLRSVSAQSVRSARYLSATEGQNKYGMAEARPVIEITTQGRNP